MHRFSHFQGGAINGAIAAIDIALWDIKGKALGVPVHSLLGGPCRTHARVYGHAYGKTTDELVENCVALKEAGFNAVGHINPFLDEREDEPFFASHVSHMSRAIETVRRVREALGGEVDMLLELHRRLTPAEAIDFIPRIERYLPYWCEDPIRPENPDAMAEVARRVHAPIATGERYASLHDFRALFARSGAGFARVDVALCGGITGARKVAAMAEAHHVHGGAAQSSLAPRPRRLPPPCRRDPELRDPGVHDRLRGAEDGDQPGAPRLGRGDGRAAHGRWLRRHSRPCLASAWRSRPARRRAVRRSSARSACAPHRDGFVVDQ